MKVSGFTFVKNALKFDYPIVEAIQSILPICDEVIVAVGKSEDETLALINSIDSDKIKVIETEWDESLREGGQVLAEETNKAFKAISKDSDWAFYIQGDEVIHENYLATVLDSMKKYVDNKKVDGLLFNYSHFYGSYDYVCTAESWYAYEVRVIRPESSFYSYKDAQGFRKGDNEKLKVKLIDAYIYHYGWVRPPKTMQKKQEEFNKLWHDDEWVDKNVLKGDEFKYLEGAHNLKRFDKTHPKVMKERVDMVSWKFDVDISRNKLTLKHILKEFFKNYLGLDFYYNNYTKI